MTDVMVLALMIFYFNSSDYTEASVLPGAYFFAASVLLTMLAYGWANTVTPSVARPVPMGETTSPAPAQPPSAPPPRPQPPPYPIRPPASAKAERT